MNWPDYYVFIKNKAHRGRKWVQYRVMVNKRSILSLPDLIGQSRVRWKEVTMFTY